MVRAKSNRRAFLLSLDAFVAVGLLLVLVVFLSSLTFTYSSSEVQYQRLYYTGKDLLNVVENVKIADLRDFSTIQYYIDKGAIIEDDMNKTLLDLIGGLWSKGNITEANNITREIFATILNNTKFGYELLINGDSIYFRNASSNNYYARLHTIASGFSIGKPVSGFVSRAYVTKTRKLGSTFAYFGGYVGDGNITKIILLPSYENITEVYMEMDAGSDFSLYINDLFSGTYTKNSAGNLTADKWFVDSSYFGNFQKGANNTINIIFGNKTNNYVGGGYIKITYNTLQFITEGNVTTYDFPGIKGTINLFDSFYVPGKLEGMDIFLNFTSNSTVFLDIGNTTVFEGNLSPATIQNSSLAFIFNYSALSERTIPLRVGHIARNATNQTGNVTDAILTTSRVSDMGIEDIPNGSANISRIEAAIELDKLFVDIVLNRTGNRVGLVSYRSTVPSSTGCDGWIEPLTTNSATLKCQIENYDELPGGVAQRCPCCAIRQGITYLDPPYSSPLSRKRAIVLMSDGSAGSSPPGQCPMQNSTDTDADAAVKEACDAYQNHSILVYTIGFGQKANNTMLQQIASCGGGQWFASTNFSGLEDIYREIAIQLANESILYDLQKVINTTIKSSLHPNSNIKFNYTPNLPAIKYGDLSLIIESKRLRNSTGDNLTTEDTTGTMNGTKLGFYFVTNNSQVLDAKITSYSANYWTDRLFVKGESTNWSNVYWLGNYSSTYLGIGDPYTVQIPVSYVKPGENNSVRLGVGSSPSSPFGGSPDSRVIYTLLFTGINLEGYSPVFPKAKGATFTIYYDTDADNIPDGSLTVSLGPDPTDIFDPERDSIDHAFMRLLDGLNFILDPNPGSYGSGSLGDPYDGINSTNPIDLEITSAVSFDSISVAEIPSLWGPVTLELRVWS